MTGDRTSKPFAAAYIAVGTPLDYETPIRLDTSLDPCTTGSFHRWYRDGRVVMGHTRGHRLGAFSNGGAIHLVPCRTCPDHPQSRWHS